MTMYAGFAGYFAARLHQEKAKTKKLAELFLDPRWPWPLTSAVFGIRAKFGKWTRRQRLIGSQGGGRLQEGFASPEHRDARLDHRADADDNHAHLHIETGQRLADPDWPCAATFTGSTRADELPVGVNLLSWVDLMHEIMATLDVGNAVLAIWPTRQKVDSDTTFVSIVLDTPTGDHNLGVSGAFELQRRRANYWRPELGDKYIRHPRWGTYLRREHLDRVGGLSRVRDEVPLARVTELGGAGDLIYLQCTEHPAGALTPEGEQVRQALEDVLAPIVAPPRPQEQVQGAQG